jgi:hypothetical protein
MKTLRPLRLLRWVQYDEAVIFHVSAWGCQLSILEQRVFLQSPHLSMAIRCAISLCFAGVQYQVVSAGRLQAERMGHWGAKSNQALLVRREHHGTNQHTSFKCSSIPPVYKPANMEQQQQLHFMSKRSALMLQNQARGMSSP